MEPFIYYIPKVLVATLCGAMVGWDRQKKNKSAGLKTNIVICVASCLFTATGFIIAGDTVGSDATRVAAQIVSGVGFLGAGAMFKSKNTIVGATTAALIWFLAAIGMMVGSGMLTLPIVITAGFLICMEIINWVEGKM